MNSLYLLIPLSVGLAVAVLAFFAWAVFGGQFDDLDSASDALSEDDL